MPSLFGIPMPMERLTRMAGPIPVQRNRGYPRQSGYPRVDKDFYVEPRWVVHLLLDVESFEGPVHDPACGSGTIPSVCLERGIPATGSDIVHRGFGEVRDFFSCTDGVDNIICNPPYRRAEAFLRHSLELAKRKVALILPLTFLESRRRDRLFIETPPMLVMPCSDRPSMPPGVLEGERDHWGAVVQPASKGGTMPYAWFIFVRGFRGDTVMRRLPLRSKSAVPQADLFLAGVCHGVQ
jgi:hypothetical protein